MNGRILSLHAGGAGLVKAPRALLVVDTGGARGDRHHGRDPRRALLATGEASYAALAAEGIPLAFGSLGENVVVRGLPATPLAAGTRLWLGTAVVEVTGPCPVCRTLVDVHPLLPKAAHGRRGNYLRVLQAGSARVGDPVGSVGEGEWVPVPVRTNEVARRTPPRRDR